MSMNRSALLRNRRRPLALAALLTVGCAGSAPWSGPATSVARVTYNYSDPIGLPCSIELKDAFAQELTIETPGYRPLYVRLKPTQAGWQWRNVTFGPRIMMGIDLEYGEVYLLTKDQCVAAHAGLATEDDLLPDCVYIVVGQRGPQWRRIGRLPPMAPS
jgi:hypothetical protein